MIVVAIVLAVVLAGGKSSAGGIPKGGVTVGTLTNALPGAADVEAQFKGIPQSGTTLGWPFAPATMVVYIDLQCPVCQAFETQDFPGVVSKYVRTKKLKVIVKPWAFIGPDSFRGQKAMIAAAAQNKAFNFAQVLYDNQGTENTGWLSDGMVYNAAASVPGLDVKKLLADRSSGSVKSAAASVAADALAKNVNATPSIFIGKSGTTPKLFYAGFPSEQKLFAAIDAALS